MWLPLVEVLISGSSATTAPQDGDPIQNGVIGVGVGIFWGGGGGVEVWS